MFILPRGITNKEGKFDPNSHLIFKKKKSQSKSLKTTAAVMWMQDVLQIDEIKIEEAFQTHCLFFLDVLNIIFPCKYNVVVSTVDPSDHRRSNMSQFLKTLNKHECPYSEDFPIENFFSGKPKGVKQCASCLCWLQEYFEKNGVQKESKDEKRTFTLLTSSVAQKKDLVTTSDTSESKDTSDSNKSEESDGSSGEEKEKEKEKKKGKETKPSIDRVNQYLIENDVQEIQPNQEDYKLEIKNIFWLDFEKRNLIIEKRQTEIVDQDSDEEKENFNKENNTITDEDFLSSDDDEGNWNELKIKEKNQFSSSDNENEDEFNKVLDKEIGDENINLSDSNSNSNSNSNSDSDSSNGEESEKGIKKEIGIEIEKANESSSESSSEQVNENESENEDEKSKNSIKVPFVDSSISSEVNFSGTESDDKQINIDTSEESNGTNNSTNSEKDGKKSSNKENSGDSEDENNKKQKKNNGKEKKKKEANGEEIKPIDRLVGVPIVGEDCEYLTNDLKQLFKIKKKEQKKKNYLYLIFFLINTLDEWKHNAHEKSIAFGNSQLAEKYDELFQKVFIETKDIAKIGYYRFHCQIPKKEDPRKKKEKENEKKKTKDQNDLLLYSETESISSSNMGSQIDHMNKKEEKDQKREENNQNYQNAEIELNKKTVKIKSKEHKNQEIFQAILSNQLQLLLNPKNLKQLILKADEKKKNDECVIKFAEQSELIRCLMAILYFQQNKNKKNAIGYNPTSEIQLDHTDFKKYIFPPPPDVNKSFYKLYSSIQEIDLRKNPKDIIEQYYSSGSVNFFTTLVVEKEYPLKSVFLKLRKKNITIGYKKSILYKIPLKDEVEVFKHQTQRIFTIQWKENRACRASKPQKVIIICKRSSERSLLAQSILHFTNKFNKSKRKNKQTKKVSNKNKNKNKTNKNKNSNKDKNIKKKIKNKNSNKNKNTNENKNANENKNTNENKNINSNKNKNIKKKNSKNNQTKTKQTKKNKKKNSKIDSSEDEIFNEKKKYIDNTTSSEYDNDQVNNNYTSSNSDN
ncbi:hypothetical protein M0812_02339 [Anaeramoeba flamelloides]|uniref:Uncharacterized protein n=1 Tax=Anaeramoeba flamelloides TaxID=1746091 RepID=A0AAV7YZN9_9EUKA|nr:hypothetical protein M0812_02339 [Anaeramoeba flamelloides]